ncbi:hypothetical protein L2E82_15340 [Cichorium intybus]|uniref:Uncharacterized protein n=1 Tax=Cichorium intybus TaxID=13427 RepID=A0ACB9F2Y8_CICIN|nr:hypothetical protein L2E82_15340 [Cichorium intybus]
MPRSYSNVIGSGKKPAAPLPTSPATGLLLVSFPFRLLLFTRIHPAFRPPAASKFPTMLPFFRRCFYSILYLSSSEVGNEKSNYLIESCSLLNALFFNFALLNSSYPGGLASYINTARELLAYSKAGKNPSDGFAPSAIPAALGVSVMKEYHVNSVSIPRKGKEAIGAASMLPFAD